MPFFVANGPVSIVADADSHEKACSLLLESVLQDKNAALDVLTFCCFLSGAQHTEKNLGLEPQFFWTKDLLAKMGLSALSNGMDTLMSQEGYKYA